MDCDLLDGNSRRDEYPLPETAARSINAGNPSPMSSRSIRVSVVDRDWISDTAHLRLQHQVWRHSSLVDREATLFPFQQEDCAGF